MGIKRLDSLKWCLQPSRQHEKRVVSCNWDTLKNGVAVGLDAASLGADAFGAEEQYAKLAIGLTDPMGAMQRQFRDLSSQHLQQGAN